MSATICNIYICRLTTPLKRIWICKLLLFQQTLNKQKICFSCFIHNLFFFSTLVNFSFANPDFFFKSFNFDISLPLLDYTASFVTQKKKKYSNPISQTSFSVVHMQKEKKININAFFNLFFLFCVECQNCSPYLKKVMSLYCILGSQRVKPQRPVQKLKSWKNS